MIRAVIFDCFGVLLCPGGVDEDLRALVSELKGKVKLGILSNMSKNEIPERIGEDFADEFGEIMVSGEMGVAKPDQRAFLMAVSKMGEFASDCLLIDDSERNCTGAEMVGMKAIHYTNADDLRQKLADYGIV